MSSPTYGIELKMADSCIALCRGNAVENVAVQNNDVTIFATTAHNGATCFHSAGSLKKELDLLPLLCRKYDDNQQRLHHREFLTQNASNGRYELRVRPAGEKETRPVQIEQILTEILKDLTKNAVFGKHESLRALVTVPGYFDDQQRTALQHSVEKAGWEVTRLVDDAAAIAFASDEDCCDDDDDHQQQAGDGKVTLICDLARDHFEASTVRSWQSEGRFEMLRRRLARDLGVEKFEDNLFAYCTEQIRTRNKLGYEEDFDGTAVKRLRRHCRAVMEELDVTTSAVLRLNELSINDEIGISFDVEMHVTREVFEQINFCHFRQMNDVLKEVINGNAIRRVILVGDVMPRLESMVRNHVGRNAEIKRRKSRGNMAAEGAAVLAAILNPSQKWPGEAPEIALEEVAKKEVTQENRKMVKFFGTSCDNQTVLKIPWIVDSGAKKLVVGAMKIFDLTQAPKEKVRIKVELLVGVRGSLSVWAEQVELKKKLKIVWSKKMAVEEELDRVIGRFRKALEE